MRRVALTLGLVAVCLAHVQTDSLLGETGNVQAANIRIEPAPSSAPNATNRGAPGRATPQANAPRPRTRAAASRKPSSWSDRGYVSLNGSWPVTSNGFTGISAFTQNVEAATVTTTYGGARPPVLDVGGAARVWRNLAVGAALTWLSQATDGVLSASIPHPFLFNTPRTVTGDVADVPRRELALHANASWVVPAGRRAQLAIFGGPSYFRVKQRLVTDVATSSAYPYDTATFVSATAADTSQSQVGFNGGLDLTARVWRYVGVGAIARYSRASLQFPAGLGRDVTVRAGGLRIGGGIRLAF
jgi:hypothetical protein